MSKNLASTAAIGCLALLSFGCDPENESEVVKAASSPVWDGPDSVIDAGDSYNYVVNLPGCSGVLITPVWVLTASHCFSDYPGNAPLDPEDDFDVVLHWNPDDPDDEYVVPHTFGKSGGVWRRIDDPNVADLIHVAQDLAVFRLDERVPDSLARPIHITRTPNGACPSGIPDDFTATSIGFGNSMQDDLGTEFCGNIQELRRFSEHDGWRRHGQVSGGAVYAKNFEEWLWYCDAYSGIAAGDSGGALVRNGNLCGIVSTYTFSPSNPIFPLEPPWLFVNYMAAVDSAETIHWLETFGPDQNGILDPAGNFDGECPNYEATCNAGECNERDFNEDGIPDVCDCLFPIGFEDSDGDERIDCIDSCPYDAPVPLATGCASEGDGDCDGICDSLDICDRVHNPDQANANTHAENAWADEMLAWNQHEIVTMGDACEPVPVPAGNPGPYEVVDEVVIQSTFLYQVHRQIVQDELVVVPQRSRLAEGAVGGVPEYVPTNVPTQLRFCQYAEDPGVLPCDDAALVSTNELHNEISDPALEMPSWRYHRITLDLPLSVRGANVTLDYDDVPHDFRWNYVADAAFWELNGIIDVPPPEDDAGFVHGGPASGLNGRIWLHAATAIGTANAVQTGTHGGVPLAGTQELASRYFDLDPEYLYWGNKTFPIQLAVPLFIWQTLSDPPPDGRYGGVDNALPGDSEMLVRISDDEFGLLGLDGTAQPLGDNLGPALHSSLLDSSIVWASAAEPSGHQGKQNPNSLGVSHDGQQVQEASAVSEDGVLVGKGDRGFGLSLGALSSGRLREGFLPVYSRTLGIVFLIGGVDETGQRLGTIGRLTVDDREGADLFSGLASKEVLAATYSYKTRSLYVLDRYHDNCVGTVDEILCERRCEEDDIRIRMMRIDVWTGQSQVIATFDAESIKRRDWFGSDLAGNILLSVSDETSERHAVVRFNVEDESFEHLQSGPGPLAFPVLVDANGYRVYTRTGQDQAEGVRYATFSGTPLSLSDLELLF